MAREESKPGDEVHERIVTHLLLLFPDLGIVDGHEIVVADVTTPRSIAIIIKFTYNMDP